MRERGASRHYCVPWKAESANLRVNGGKFVKAYEAQLQEALDTTRLIDPHCHLNVENPVKEPRGHTAISPSVDRVGIVRNEPN